MTEPGVKTGIRYQRELIEIGLLDLEIARMRDLVQEKISDLIELMKEDEEE